MDREKGRNPKREQKRKGWELQLLFLFQQLSVCVISQFESSGALEKISSVFSLVTYPTTDIRTSSAGVKPRL